MARKKPITDDSAFKTISRSADDVLKELESEIRKSVTFDAIDVTNKIIEFGKVLTGIPLYRYQEKMAFRIIYSIITFEGASITMLLSRQSGKSETLAFVINSLSVLLPALAKYIPDLEYFKDGIKIGLFAPQSDQVVTTYSRALNRLGSENAEQVMGDPDLEVELTKPSRYELSNGSFMLGQVASKQSKIESKTYDLVICEEAQDIDSFIIQKSIEPMVSATSGTIIKCGTTGTQKNDYWYEIQHNREKSRKVKDPRLVYHFEFNYKAIFTDRREQYDKDGKKFHLFYEKDVRNKEIKWGRQSTAFKLAFALEWDLETGMLFTEKQFEKILNRKKGLGVFDEDDLMIAGLDIGKDVASTVLTLGKLVYDEEGQVKKEVVGWFELGNIDYEKQHHIIIDIIQEYNIRIICCDYTGVGKPVVDRLEYAVDEYTTVIRFTFSTSSKSDMWYNLIQHRDSGRLVIPANKTAQATSEWQNFREQMLNCEKWYDGAYLCAQKADGYLDDYVDSLGLMCLINEIEEQDEVEVESENVFYPEATRMLNFMKSNANNGRL